VEIYTLLALGSKSTSIDLRFSYLDPDSKALEIAKHTASFTASDQAGSMFVGVMMSAIRLTMDGKAGLHGWQSVFIIGATFQS